VAKSRRARLGRGHHGPEREYGSAAQGGGTRPATEGAPHGQGEGARGGQGGARGLATRPVREARPTRVHAEGQWRGRPWSQSLEPWR